MKSNDRLVLIEEQRIILNFNTMLMDLFLHMENTSISTLTPPPCIEMHIPSEENDPSCMCVLGVRGHVCVC